MAGGQKTARQLIIIDETAKIIRIVIDSSKAIDWSNEATRAPTKIKQQTGAATTALQRIQISISNMGSVFRASSSCR